MSYQDLLDDYEPESQNVRSQKKTHLSSATSQETLNKKQANFPKFHANKESKNKKENDVDELLNFSGINLQNFSDSNRSIQRQNQREVHVDQVPQPNLDVGYQNIGNQYQNINEYYQEEEKPVLQRQGIPSSFTKENTEHQGDLESVDQTLKKIGKYLLMEQTPFSDQGSSQLCVVWDTQENRVVVMRITPTAHMPKEIINKFIIEHQKFVEMHNKCDQQVRLVDFMYTDQYLFTISELITYPNLKTICKQFGKQSNLIIITFIQNLMSAVQAIRKCYQKSNLGNLKLKNIFYNEDSNSIQISDFGFSYQELKQQYQKLNDISIKETNKVFHKDIQSIAAIAFQLFYGKESIHFTENFRKFKLFLEEKGTQNDRIQLEIEQWLENCLFDEDYTEEESMKFIKHFIKKSLLAVQLQEKKIDSHHQKQTSLHDVLFKFISSQINLQEQTEINMQVKTSPPQYIFKDFQFKYSDKFLRLLVDCEIQQKLYKTQKRDKKSVYDDNPNIISYRNKQLFYDIAIYDTIGDLTKYNLEIMKEIDDYPYFDLTQGIETKNRDVEHEYNIKQYNFDIYERMITKKSCSMRVKDKNTDIRYVIHNFQPRDDIQFQDILKQISINVFLKFSEHQSLELNVFSDNSQEIYDEHADCSLKENTCDVTTKYLEQLYKVATSTVDPVEAKVQTLKEAFIIKKNKFLSFYMILDDFDFSLKDYFFLNEKPTKNIDEEILNNSIIFCSNRISRIMRKLRKQQICHNNIAPENIIFSKHEKGLKLMVRNFEKCIICKTGTFKNQKIKISKNMENLKYKPLEIQKVLGPLSIQEKDFINFNCNPILIDIYSLGCLMLELRNGMILHQRHLFDKQVTLNFSSNASQELILLMLNSNTEARIKYSRIIYFTENQVYWPHICQNSDTLLPYKKTNMKSIPEENGILIALQFARICRKLQYFQQAYNILEILKDQYITKKESIKDPLKISLIMREQLGNYHRDIDEMAKGVNYYQECTQIMNKHDIGKPLDNAKLLIKCADIQEGGGCLQWYNTALSIMREIMGTGNSELMSLLINIGETYESKRDYRSAQLFYEELFIVLKNTNGFFGLIGIKLLDKLGTLYFYLSDYQRAIQKFKYALEIKYILFFKDAYTIAESYNSIGECNRLFGNPYKALQWYEKALSLIWDGRKELGQFLAIIYNNMGICYKDRGKYKIALKMYEESYRLKCDLFTNTSTTSLETLLNIGVLHNILGYNTKGMQIFDEICESLKTQLLTTLPLYAESIQNKGLSLYNLRQFEKCLVFLKQALDLKLELFGKKHVSMAITQTNIALTYGKLNEYQLAVDMFEEARLTYKCFYSTHKVFKTIDDNIRYYKTFINPEIVE